jgi:uncharacterized phage protein (TIGR02218 family)
MSYASLEASIQDGNPIELYEFNTDLEYWRYTSSVETLIDGNVSWTPEVIKRTNIGQTDDISKGGISVTFPITNDFAFSFLGYAPEGITTLTVYRIHGSEGPTSKVSYWKGRVLSAKANDNQLTLDCESVFSSLKRPGLRARFERSCRHTPYGEACTVSMDLFRTDATVVGRTDTTVTAVEFDVQPDGYYVGGILLDSFGTKRFIIGHSGSTLTVSRKFNQDTLNTAVIAYPGCDKAKATCISKFDNVLNFGGFPYIPGRNPFSGSIV